MFQKKVPMYHPSIKESLVNLRLTFMSIINSTKTEHLKKLQTITQKLQNQCARRAMNTVGWVVCQRPLAVLVNNCLAPTLKM